MSLGLSRRAAVARFATLAGAGLVALAGTTGAKADRRRGSSPWGDNGDSASTASNNQNGQDASTSSQNGGGDQGSGGTSQRQDFSGTDTFGRTVTANSGVGASTTGTTGAPGADGVGASNVDTTQAGATQTVTTSSGRPSGRGPSRGDS